MAFKCNEPYYAQQDGSTTVSAIGVALGNPQIAYDAAGAAAVAKAHAAGLNWFRAKNCANAAPDRECRGGCPDKQGGSSYSSEAFAYTMKTVVALPFGLKLYIAEASASWGGVVICRCTPVEVEG
jgi:hypothetical protein